MKKSISLIAIILCFGITYDAMAQMSKKEQKEWKKRIKKLEPSQYKQLLDENKSLKGQLTSVKTERDNLDERIAEKDEQIASYNQQVSSLNEELAAAQSQQKAENVAAAKTGGTINENEGVVFKVQLGAFRQKDLKDYDNSPNFSAEDENGLQKFTLGVFRDYYKADTFKKHLRSMGVKEAWVVSYRDGQRVPIKEVLGTVKRS